MRKPGDKSPQEKPPDPSPRDPGAGDSSAPPGDDKRSGRISYDERGNSVWEWQLETGIYSRDISTQRLRKLDLDDLSIAETAAHPRPAGLGRAPGTKSPGGGFNPYDNSPTAGGNVGGSPYNSGGPAANKPEPPPPVAPRKPMDLKKLEEWIEIRKRVQQHKREDEDD